MTQGRVVISAKNTRFDVSHAAEYGDLYYLIQGERPSSLSTDDLIERMTRELRLMRFDPEQDFIALTGNTIDVALLLTVASWLHPRLRILLFDARSDGRYVMREIERTEQEVA